MSKYQMTLMGVYQLLAVLLVVGVVGIAIGGRGVATGIGRMVIPVGFLYACLTVLSYGYFASTTLLPPDAGGVTFFEWTLSPLLPAMGVYLGIFLLVVLLGWFIHDLRFPGASQVRSRVSAVLGYGSAIVATFCAVRIPFAVQRMLAEWAAG